AWGSTREGPPACDAPASCRMAADPLRVDPAPHLRGGKADVDASSTWTRSARGSRQGAGASLGSAPTARQAERELGDDAAHDLARAGVDRGSGSEPIGV